MFASTRFWFGLLSAMACAAGFAQSTAFTPDDLVRLKRLSDPQVSPDGHYVAYVVAETDVDADKRRSDLWLIDLTAKEPAPRRLTQNPANDSNPRWSADSKLIYFLSTRSGTSQVWRLQLGGGEATQVTDYPRDVGTLVVAPAGDRIAVSMEVLPSCDPKCTKEKLDAKEKSKVSGRTYDQLFIRHWDTWWDGTRSHLFTALLGPDGKAGAPVDLTKALDADVPSKPFGGDEEWTFSADGSRVLFTARVAGRTEPWSTNFDVYEVKADGSSAPAVLTAQNQAWDTQPRVLKDGSVAYLAMDRPTFEADRFHVELRDSNSGNHRSVTDKWDRSIDRLGLAGDGSTLLATTDDIGQHSLFAVDVKTGKPRTIVGPGDVTEYSAAKDVIVYAFASLAGPPDLYVTHTNGSNTRRLTNVNQDILGQRAMSEFEQFSFKGWNDETVYGYVMKPFGFTPGKKYPVAFVIHGGPQVAFGNAWSYRWNPQVWAGHGFGVVFIDFHGSPGYGQKFTDAISGDWGGKPLEDLQKGFAAATVRYDWLDGNNACAAGASYGGFMINWIAGNWPDRFKCLVNHDGIFDARTMYYSTEELWFDEWEHGGPYFEKPENFEKFNPSAHVKQWKSPMLVIHGEQDFRVPVEQGISTFTALQRRGIESRLLVFPNENHWVLKPNNSLLWHKTVFDWLDSHLKR
jgi:dipeptidyl aminopeptidase/acylaminoacyl peptidase